MLGHLRAVGSAVKAQRVTQFSHYGENRTGKLTLSSGKKFAAVPLIFFFSFFLFNIDHRYPGWPWPVPVPIIAQNKCDH